MPRTIKASLNLKRFEVSIARMVSRPLTRRLGTAAVPTDRMAARIDPLARRQRIEPPTQLTGRRRKPIGPQKRQPQEVIRQNTLNRTGKSGRFRTITRLRDMRKPPSIGRRLKPSSRIEPGRQGPLPMIAAQVGSQRREARRRRNSRGRTTTNQALQSSDGMQRVKASASRSAFTALVVCAVLSA